MVSQQVKFAQQEIFKAGKELGSAKIRLEGSAYEKDINAIMERLTKLNNRIVKDINKK